MVGSSEYGVAKNCNIISVKATSTNQGSVGTILKAIDWVSEQHIATEGALSVLNLSVGGDFSPSLNNAINDASDAGILVVAAAGNGNGDDACTRSPASAEKAITVGIVNNADEYTGVGNIGPCVDIFAPGGGTSTGFTDDTATRTMAGKLPQCFFLWLLVQLVIERISAPHLQYVLFSQALPWRLLLSPVWPPFISKLFRPIQRQKR